VHRLAARISARTGIAFTVHMLRHTHATELIRRGVPIEVVARLLTHRSSTTTSQTYIHLDAADVREALVRAGVWDQAGNASFTLTPHRTGWSVAATSLRERSRSRTRWLRLVLAAALHDRRPVSTVSRPPGW
jgi:hypothetical protein